MSVIVIIISLINISNKKKIKLKIVKNCMKIFWKIFSFKTMKFQWILFINGLKKINEHIKRQNVEQLIKIHHFLKEIRCTKCKVMLELKNQ